MPVYVAQASVGDLSQSHVTSAVNILEPAPRHPTSPRPNDATGIVVADQQPNQHLIHPVDCPRRWRCKFGAQPSVPKRVETGLDDVGPIRHTRLHIAWW